MDLGFRRIYSAFVVESGLVDIGLSVHFPSTSLTRGPDGALSGGPDGGLRGALLAVPVGDHAGVVQLDHPHARAGLRGDLRERDPFVDAQRDEARPEVARASALRRRAGRGGARGLAVAARARGLASPCPPPPVAPVVGIPEAAVVGGEDRALAGRPARGQEPLVQVVLQGLEQRRVPGAVALGVSTSWGRKMCGSRARS